MNSTRRWVRAVVQMAACAMFFLAAAAQCASAQQQKPKVRTITAFVRLDPGRYEQQVATALAFLQKAKGVYERAGYDVETLRLVTQPFPRFTQDMTPESSLAFFTRLDALAAKDDLEISVGPAMLLDSDNPIEADRLAQVIAKTTHISGSVVIAGSDGIHWRAIHAAAGVIKYLEDNTPHSEGNFRFAALATVPEYVPFFPAAYHDGFGRQFAVGLESANVIAEVLAKQQPPYEMHQALVAQINNALNNVDGLGSILEGQTGWDFMGIDLSPAPSKDVSIGAAIESAQGGNKLGSPGTLSTIALITGALSDILLKKTGFSGVMLPVLEDSVLAQRWSEGALTLNDILSYSAVCGTGLDAVPLPGEVTQQQIERILGDVASLSVKWSKPLTARLLPVAGKHAGDRTEFDDPRLVNTTLQPLR